jgi:hypothetical protein
MSFYTRPKNNPRGWQLCENKWKDGKRKTHVVPVASYYALGFSLTMTQDEAKARAKQLNAKNTIEKHKTAEAARNARLHERIDSAFLPEGLVTEFTAQLEGATFGTAKHKEKLLSHWQTMQKLIAAIKKEPVHYANEMNARMIYKWMLDQAISKDYMWKLLRVLNMWGQFVCEKEGRFYRDVPSPKGHVLQQIIEAQEAMKGRRRASERLTPEKLKGIKFKAKPAHYGWHCIGVWYGLRPDEIDKLKDKTTWRLEKQGDIQVLCVYQAKLTSVPKDQRWKAIPIFLPGQREALEYIKSGTFERPTAKAQANYFPGTGIKLQGGRKGFEALMRSYGQDMEDISRWLGHRGQGTTRQHYTDYTIARYKPVKRRKAG